MNNAESGPNDAPVGLDEIYQGQLDGTYNAWSRLAVQFPNLRQKFCAECVVWRTAKPNIPPNEIISHDVLGYCDSARPEVAWFITPWLDDLMADRSILGLLILDQWSVQPNPLRPGLIIRLDQPQLHTVYAWRTVPDDDNDPDVDGLTRAVWVD